MKLWGWVLLIFLFLFGLTECFPQTYTLPGGMQKLRQKLNLAVSDYLEAISECNGALRDSAERQIERIQQQISRSKDQIQKMYDPMVKRLSEIYSELNQYIDKPNELKSMVDTIAGAIPGLGAGYSGANTINDLINKHANQENVADVLRRVGTQLKEIGKVSEAYKKWADFGNEVAQRLDSLRRRFRKDCRGRDLGTWRYDPATVDQTGAADISVTGKDKASGKDIFDANVKNNTGDIIIIYFPRGGWVIPDDLSYQRMVITGGRKIVKVPPGQSKTTPLDGFCADPKKYPPPSGNPRVYVPPTRPRTFIPDDNPFNKEFSKIPEIPRIVEKLIKEGKIPPTGLPKEMERLTLIQWLIWHIVENFNPDDGKKKIEKQVRKSGGKQTPEQIKELNRNIWEGINLVQKEIKKEGEK